MGRNTQICFVSYFHLRMQHRFTMVILFCERVEFEELDLAVFGRVSEIKLAAALKEIVYPDLRHLARRGVCLAVDQIIRSALLVERDFKAEIAAELVARIYLLEEYEIEPRIHGYRRDVICSRRATSTARGAL